MTLIPPPPLDKGGVTNHSPFCEVGTTRNRGGYRGIMEEGASLKKGLTQLISESAIWRSIFRTGIPDTDLKRSMVMYHNFFLHIFPAKMKRHGLRFSYTFCLGGISCLLFIILTVTGILLMFLYTPSIERAYFDMQALALVFNGKILRNLHRWSAHGMVATVFLHMVRVFYTRSYRCR